jgi:hypothetical protein
LSFQAIPASELGHSAETCSKTASPGQIADRKAFIVRRGMAWFESMSLGYQSSRNEAGEITFKHSRMHYAPTEAGAIAFEYRRTRSTAEPTTGSSESESALGSTRTGAAQVRSARGVCQRALALTPASRPPGWTTRKH